MLIGRFEFRTKLSSPALSQSISQLHQPSLSFNKRKIIDLTLSDDDDGIASVSRKKSRSSSQSTDSITEPLGKNNGATNQGKTFFLFVLHLKSSSTHVLLNHFPLYVYSTLRAVR
jgi:hypothetical protein